MTTQPRTVQTFSALPAMTMEAEVPANPLKGVLLTVFALKIVVSAFLIATVSLAPPVATDARYMNVAAN